MDIHENLSLQICRKLLHEEVNVICDRPLGTVHPRWNFVYPVNYGYIDGEKAPDGHFLDAYYLGINYPIKNAKGICIAIAHRNNDDDDKIIVVPNELSMDNETIYKLIYFQERWFDTVILRS